MTTAASSADTTPSREGLGNLALLLRYVRPYRGRVVVAVVALFVAAAAFLLMGQGLKGVVDRGFAGGDAGALDTALVLMFEIGRASCRERV